MSFHKWCHGFFRVPSPLLNLFLIPLRPLWSRSIWLLTPYSNATRAVIPNEHLPNASKKAPNSKGGEKKVKGGERRKDRDMEEEKVKQCINDRN